MGDNGRDGNKPDDGVNKTDLGPKNTNDHESHAESNEGEAQLNCGSCKKDFGTSKNVGELCCEFCGVWFCSNCTKFKKAEIKNVMNRPEVFWACELCLKEATEMMARWRSSRKDSERNDWAEIRFDARLHALEKTIADKITETLQVVVPNIVEKSLIPVNEQVSKSVETMSQSVNQNVQKLWSETVLGDSMTEFPKLDDPVSKLAPVKPKLTLSTAVKQAMTEQKDKELQRDSRLNNIIIHRAPESSETNAERRKDDDAKLVKDLLETMEVDAQPVKIFRLGAYKKSEASDNSSRPIKAVFQDQGTQQKIMGNAKKLRNAPTHLQNLSISYDLSGEERDKVKTMVESAKEK